MKQVLLHTCCAPCSSAIIEWMLAHHIQPIIYYYNPNIYPYEEYLIRKHECTRYAHSLGLQIIDDDYNHPQWQSAIHGLEDMGERSPRCLECFRLRLLHTARQAATLGIDSFTTTLASSRWKSLQQINQAGQWAATTINATLPQGRDHITFDTHNWRKGGLQQRRQELLSQNHFYNQVYCGCEYSLQARLPKMTKADLRTWIRAIIRGLESEFPTLRAHQSAQVCQQITDDGLWLSAGTIILYHPLADEIDTRPLLASALHAGKRVLLPKVEGQNLTLHPYTGPQSLKKGAWGIMEPDTPALALEEATGAIAIIPAMAYDAYGHRLGRGKGYYDRLLAQLHTVHTIGVCFSFQKLHTIPTEAHDIKVDEVVSPKDRDHTIPTTVSSPLP